MARKPRTKKGYIRRYAGSVRDALPALIDKGWSGSKALNYLRKVKKYHLRTQTFYDILREEKSAISRLPQIEKITEQDVVPDSIVTETDLKLSSEYQLIFEYDIYSSRGKYIRTGIFSLADDELGFLDDYLNLVYHTIETTDSYRGRRKEIDVRNVKLIKVLTKRQEPIVRVKRGQRYATR